MGARVMWPPDIPDDSLNIVSISEVPNTVALTCFIDNCITHRVYVHILI